MLKHIDALYLFDYSPNSGDLLWKNPPSNLSHLKGSIAGCLSDGYRKIDIYGMRLYAHRIVWLIFYGSEPDGFVDHINGNRSDNRISNLRIVTVTQNAWNSKMRRNNTSGVKGVSWHSPSGKWIARIRVCGKRKSIGSFDNIEDAKVAINKARLELHGEFSNSGN